MGGKLPGKDDRRVKRTRSALRDALVALIVERGWDGFSVQDLCERADVGRSTFYVHFADKEEVLGAGLEELGRQLRGQLAGSGGAPPLGFSRGLFEAEAPPTGFEGLAAGALFDAGALSEASGAAPQNGGSGGIDSGIAD